MVKSTIAALECAAQVRMAASNRASSGSAVKPTNSARIAGAVSAGSIAATSRRKDSSISPRPIATRPRSRVRVRPRRNASSPARNSSGAIQVTSKDRAWTIRVVPILAPSITASAGSSSTTPLATNDVAIRPVAVLLCRIAVTPIPESSAIRRLRRQADSMWRRSAP